MDAERCKTLLPELEIIVEYAVLARALSKTLLHGINRSIEDERENTRADLRKDANSC